MNVGQKNGVSKWGKACTRKHRRRQQNGRLRGRLRRNLPKFDKIHQSTIQEAQQIPSRKTQRPTLRHIRMKLLKDRILKTVRKTSHIQRIFNKIISGFPSRKLDDHKTVGWYIWRSALKKKKKPKNTIWQNRPFKMTEKLRYPQINNGWVTSSPLDLSYRKCLSESFR